MDLSLVIAVVAQAAIVLVLAVLYRKLSSRQDSDFSIDQCLVLTVEKYRPMERLLCEDDFRFLISQRGFSPDLGRRFRAERRGVFRGYLRSLEKDFSRIVLVCKLMVVHADQDRANLAKGLIWQRLMFSLGILAVEARLLLHAAGVGTVEVRGLIESLGEMQALLRVQLRQYQAANIAAA